jgi:hypothetical protein
VVLCSAARTEVGFRRRQLLHGNDAEGLDGAGFFINLCIDRFVGSATDWRRPARNRLEASSFGFGETLPTVSHHHEDRTAAYGEHQ